METSLLEELSEQISKKASIISQFLRSNSYPQPSFDRNGPIITLPAGAPQEVRVARQSLIDASLKIFQLAVGPAEFLPNIAVGYQYTACLQWLCHFNIFHLVPLKGNISYTELAALANVPEQRLKSIVRMAMTNTLFSEPAPNIVTHSATSALFVENENVYAWATYLCETSAPTAAKLVEASVKWPGSEKKNEAAYNIAFETDLPFFDDIALDPEKTKRFARYMKNVTTSEGTDIKHLVAGFDWAGLGTSTVVDVGGSTGNASIALAKAFPDLRFVVQDIPSNAADGQASLSTLPESISSRITFQGHNFFQPQLVKGAEVYLFRMIFHDWPKEEAIKILRNNVLALKPGSRLLIMDSVLPLPGSIPASQERLLRVRDLTMLQAFNSQERDLEAWEELLAAADERLKLVNVVQPFGSAMSVIEVVSKS